MVIGFMFLKQWVQLHLQLQYKLNNDMKSIMFRGSVVYNSSNRGGKSDYDNLIKYNDIGNIKKQSWNYLLNNYTILNMRSTLKAENLNWTFQPEFIPCYITESMYKNKYIEKYEKLS